MNPTVTERVLGACLQAIRQDPMISRGDTVICAVSGGPDSMCLLHVMAKLGVELDLSLHVAHLNHHMRLEAPKDALMVKNFANGLGIPFTEGHADVFSLAKTNRTGLEEAGRIARYRFFYRVKNEIGADKIALGHNLNDQAETVLMRLVRGSGVRGLSGIPPVNGPIIRPLLNVSRKDIEAYCQENGLPTMSDVYNFDPAYTRNFIRYELIPRLSQRLNPSLVDTLASTARTMLWDADYLQICAKREFLACSHKEGRIVSVDRGRMESLPYAMRSRVLEYAWENALGYSNIGSFSKQAGLGLRHVMALLDCAIPSISLPGGVTASVEDDLVRFYPVSPKAEISLGLGETDIPELGLTLSLKLLDDNDAQKVIERPQRAARVTRQPWQIMVEPSVYLDYNKCAWPMGVRTRKDGDKFAPLGMKGKQRKLQDFFVSCQVPRLHRDFIPLLVSGDDIVWVGGLRLSEKYKITPDSRKILEVSIGPSLRQHDNCATL